MNYWSMIFYILLVFLGKLIDSHLYYGTPVVSMKRAISYALLILERHKISQRCHRTDLNYIEIEIVTTVLGYCQKSETITQMFDMVWAFSPVGTVIPVF